MTRGDKRYQNSGGNGEVRNSSENKRRETGRKRMLRYIKLVWIKLGI